MIVDDVDVGESALMLECLTGSCCRGGGGGSGGGAASRATMNGAEYSPVQQHDDDARNVERRHRRVDEEFGVVERADVGRLRSAVCVVHADGYRQRHGHRRDPRQRQHHVQVGTSRVPVLGVLYRPRHSDIPEHTHTHTHTRALEIGWELGLSLRKWELLLPFEVHKQHSI